MRKIKINFKLLIFALIIISSVVTIFILYNTFQTEKMNIYKENIELLESQYKSLLLPYENFAKYIFEREVNRTWIKQQIKIAVDDPERRDTVRETLYQYFGSFYNLLKQFNFRQLHFHLPGAISFLRMHRPEKYGDDLSNIRASIVLAAKTGEFIKGFEEGRIVNGYRMVFPIYHTSEMDKSNEEFIGTVEISISFCTICEDLTNEFNRPFHFIIKEDVVEEKVFESEQGNYLKVTFLDNYLFDREIHETIKDLSSNQKLPSEQINKNLSLEYSKKVRNGESFSLHTTVDGTVYSAVFLKIKNFENENVGYLISYKEDKKITDIINKTKLTLVFVSIIFSLLLILIYYMYRSRENALIANKAKSEFLANMSHEIRTPMNGILTAVEIIQKTDNEKKQKDFLKIIKVSADSLLQIINDILDLSKIEAGKLQLEEIPFDLREILNDVTQLIFLSASKKGLASELIIEQDVPQYIKGDPLRLKQILLNLLSNALKFTEKGTIQVLVKREQVNAAEQENIIFSVKDTGVGIDEEKQEIMFRKFSQADSTITRKFGGTGLGLAISKRLVEMMNGKIDFKSEAGKGSEFYFRVPVERANEEEIQTCELGKREADQTEGISEIALNVLVAEDNQINQAIIKEVLSGFGWNYQLVSNGKEAVEAVKNNNYDVILMDVMMPVMDGLEATERIKALPEKSKIPVVALTASVTEADLQKVFQAGMDAYIPKPIKIIDLKNTILNLISPDQWREVRRECIDMKEVKKHIDDMELYHQTIIPVFIKDLRQNLSTMGKTIKEGNHEQIAALSHAIKPGCHYAGAVVLAQRIEKIEMMAKMNQPMEKIQSVFEEYKAEAERVLKFLEDSSIR